MSPLELTALCLDPAGRYAATAGADGLLRLWGCVPLPALRGLKGLPPNSAFLGHPSAILGEPGVSGSRPVGHVDHAVT
mgnify:CR=1 FL=1